MTVLFAVGAGVTRADIPCLCADLADLLRARDGPGDVLCDVTAAAPTVVTVEALARLRMTAGRHGHRFVLAGAGAGLLGVFALMGLGGFFAALDESDGPLSREPFGEPEQWEQPLGVEEVVDTGDPPV
ncbi:MAG: STAS domain-containing protein [Actinomycetota bacterium]|nr:STAS domain-containing protein [Actinomycetota bacterium]